MVTLGTPVQGLDDLAILFHRKQAARMLLWACGYPKDTSVTEGNPRYRIVTEGRDVGAMRVKYSSCGDLPHWLYWQQGVRLPWVNRADAVQGWRVGRNLSLLQPPGYYGRNPVAQLWRGQDLDAGDCLIISNEQHKALHAVTVVSPVEDDDELQTAQYGQPGGALIRSRIVVGERLCTVRPDGSLSRGRIIRCILRLPDVLLAAAKAGQLVPLRALPPDVDPSELPTQPGTPRAKR